MEQQQMGVRRKRRTREEIINLLFEFDKSNVTVKQFCRVHGISEGVFHKWKSGRKEVRMQEPVSSGFSKIVVGPSFSEGLFAEVKGIRFYRPVSAAYLKELIA